MAVINQKEISKALSKFYSKPVAGVSLELFFTLFAVIFFAVFAIRPTLQTISGLISEIEEKQEIDQQLQRKIAALSSAQEEYQRSLSKIKLLDQSIPSKPELIKTLKVIEKSATDNNIVIDLIRLSEIPDEIVAADQSKALNRVDLYLSVRVIGDYSSIRNFVETVQEYRRTMVVEEVVFSVEDKITSVQLKATLSVRVPYFGE